MHGERQEIKCESKKIEGDFAKPQSCFDSILVVDWLQSRSPFFILKLPPNSLFFGSGTGFSL